MGVADGAIVGVRMGVADGAIVGAGVGVRMGVADGAIIGVSVAYSATVAAGESGFGSAQAAAKITSASATVRAKNGDMMRIIETTAAKRPLATRN